MAAQLARGLTNRQLTEPPVINKSTVANHVEQSTATRPRLGTIACSSSLENSLGAVHVTAVTFPRPRQSGH